MHLVVTGTPRTIDSRGADDTEVGHHVVESHEPPVERTWYFPSIRLIEQTHVAGREQWKGAPKRRRVSAHGFTSERAVTGYSDKEAVTHRDFVMTLENSA